MAHPFEPTTLDADHGWDPLNDEPAVALTNRLAEAAAVTDVGRDELAALEARFQISFTRDYPGRIGELYAGFLAACLADKQFTQDEVNAVWHLKWLFDISDEQHTQIYRRVATETYLRSVDEVMSDFAVSAAEKQFLTQLGEYLDLPADLRNLAFDTRAQMMLHDAFDVAKDDGQLTDQEVEQLRLLQTQLGKSLSLTEEDRAAYQRARLVWVIKHAPKLEPVSIPLKLPPGEWCCCRHPATFLTLPAASGPVLNREERKAKLSSDAFWNPEVGTVDEALKILDTGEVYLTNRHLWLAGREHHTKIGLHLVEDFDACPAWLDVRCNAGKTLRFAMTRNVDVFAHFLARMLREM